MSNPLVWREAVRTALTDQRRRADFRESVEKCLKVYINSRTPAGITTSPSWREEDLAPYGITRTTWSRVWKWLKGTGLLGWVAWGREERFKPATLQTTEKGHDRAVYVLTVPLPADSQEEAAAPVATAPVDISETLPPEGESFSSYPPHAHTYTTTEDGASHRLKDTSGGSAARPSRLLPPMPKLWRGDMTAKASNRKADRVAGQLEFARTLKHFVPVLDSARITDRHLAAVLRKAGFFAADWTVNDIRYALDRRPDGTAWSHDGATGVGNLAKWLAYRLEPWRDDQGWPLQSQYQRQRTEAAEAAARRHMAAERIAAQEHARQQSVSNGHFANGIAMLRSVLNKVKGGQ